MASATSSTGQTIVRAGLAVTLFIEERTICASKTVGGVGAIAGAARTVTGLAIKGLNTSIHPDSLVKEISSGVVEHMRVSGGEKDVIGNKDTINVVEFDGVGSCTLLEPGLNDVVGGREMHLDEEPVVLVKGGKFLLGKDDLVFSLISNLDV